MSTLIGRLPAVTGTVAARLGVLVLGLAGSILTARALGPAGRGEYFATMTLAAIIAQVGNLGLTSSNTFLVSRDPQLAWNLTVNSLWVGVGVGAAAALTMAVALAAGYRPMSLSVPLLWAACVIAPAMLAFTMSSSILAGLERFGAVNGWQLANALAAVLLLGCCAAAGLESGWFVAATAVAAIATVAGAVGYLARSKMGSWAFDACLFRKGLAFAARAYLALLFGFLLQRVGVTILSGHGAATEVGYLSIAMQVHDVLIIIPTSISLVLFPRLVRESGSGWPLTRQAVLATAGLMAGCVALVIAFGGAILQLMFGAAFLPAYDVLVWLLPAVVAVSITSVLSQFIVARRFPIALVALWAVGLVVTGWLASMLVPGAGAVGAAQAQSVGSAVVCAGAAALAAVERRAAHGVQT